ncbi:hypothetical protein [Carboxylicivirga marina]|uniref:Uncharacterized protein n=1 Tax=Carboxylicivirga marina TaxID=2800988 RepID=A0ABS1HGQ6_9BACT|nr:hypothetical protein [Carboxylicivirga marina]MBK3516742.1 hypothetical protein [Carboxylicivirga marina]
MKARQPLLITVLMLFSHMLFSQNSEADFKKVDDGKDWQFVLSPYAWLAANATDVGGESLRQSFNDLSSLTNFGFQMVSSAKYKRLILSLDWTYAHLATGMGGDLLTVDANVHQ